MRNSLVALLCLGVVQAAADTASDGATVAVTVPFAKGQINLDKIKQLPGVRAATQEGDAVTLKLDAYTRVTLKALEAAAGVPADRARFQLPGCVHLVMQAPCGGGGKAPCLETAHRGCFNAGPVTSALAKHESTSKALLADMRPGGGDLAWLVAVADGKKMLADDLIQTAQQANKKAVYRDLVLSGVFADDAVHIPSEFLPRARPGAVKSAAPRLEWLHSSKKALARAKAENKMILLCAHHFD